MPHKEIGRLFIVGCPRSGTTLLQSLLAAHSQILSLPETWFFNNLVPKRNRLAGALRLATPPQRGSYNRLLTAAGIPAAMRPSGRPIFIGQYARAFINVLDKWAEQQGKCIWLEKTPEHLHYVDVIERYVPGARFLHVVRSGPDNIASLHDVTSKYPVEWTSGWNFEVCVQRWVQDARLTLSHAHKPNHLLVGYRELAEQTAQTLQRVCGFVGLPFEEAMLHNYKAVAGGLITAEEKWKADVTGAIRNRNGTKFYAIFTEEQRRYILDRVAEVDLSPFGLP